MDQITKRTCSNCCSYDEERGECMNGLGWLKPTDSCGQHETQAEYDADMAALAQFRVRIGLPARMRLQD